MQHLLTLEWSVREHLRSRQGVDDTTMNMLRVGDKRFEKVHLHRIGKGVLTLAGIGEHQWLAFVPNPELAEAADSIRGVMGLAKVARHAAATTEDLGCMELGVRAECGSDGRS